MAEQGLFGPIIGERIGEGRPLSGEVVRGYDALIARLKRLEEKEIKKILRKASREATKIVQQEIAATVPESDEGDGRLAASVSKVKAEKRSKAGLGHKVSAGTDTPSDRLPYYAGWVELGTKDRFHKSGKYVGRIEARKFMRRALYENENEVLDRYGEVAKQELTKL
jgi:HK97 gp10 family phage protein